MRNVLYTSFSALILLLMLAIPALAQELPFMRPEELPQIDSGTVKEILKSDLILLDNNKRYKLDNMRIPPYEDASALDELKREFLNKSVTIYTYHDPDNNFDRYGVPLAHVVRDDNKAWIQGDMISKGLAWAFSSETSRKMMDPLLQMEQKARAQHLGFWANPIYAIKTPNNVKNYTSSYQIVEGKILSVATKQDTIFFNFGEDWKTDFTLRVSAKNWGLYFLKDISDKDLRKILDPLTWKNREVRVRGWVEESNGPLMEVTHIEQIEFPPAAKK